MQQNEEVKKANERIRVGLDLIKKHITKELCSRNVDLHNAIGILVDEYRKVGRLEY